MAPRGAATLPNNGGQASKLPKFCWNQYQKWKNFKSLLSPPLSLTFSFSLYFSHSTNYYLSLFLSLLLLLSVFISFPVSLSHFSSIFLPQSSTLSLCIFFLYSPSLFPYRCYLFYSISRHLSASIYLSMSLIGSFFLYLPPLEKNRKMSCRLFSFQLFFSCPEQTQNQLLEIFQERSFCRCLSFFSFLHSQVVAIAMSAMTFDLEALLAALMSLRRVRIPANARLLL